MTASTPMLHGSDLDECCTNVFALTDLCGLKWRKYVFNFTCQANPSEDPVLKSFSAALSHDILCAWRRCPLTGCQSGGDPKSISGAKELWVFWFGDDPNLQGIVSAELKESCHGCWEDGLPHEPRSLLFKALHNLLERCLLSRKFVRLGKWFTKPCESSVVENSSNHLSFSFSFFIHGESSVCTAVEIQQQQKMRHLTLEDVAVAATKQEGLPVLLGPYGLSGFLTGQTSHMEEMVSAKLVEEWKKFYPLDYSSDWSEPASLCQDKGVPVAVMVVVEETQMWYPSMYVVVPYEKNTPVDGSVPPKTGAVTCSGPTSLTPPASPLDPNSTDVVTGPANLPPAPNLTSGGVIDKKKLTHSLVQEVWQEITVTKPAANKNTSLSSISKSTPSFMKADSSGDTTVPTGQWDFEEPFKRTSCSCTSSSNISRPKAPAQVRSSFGISRPTPSPSYPLPSPQQQQQLQSTQQNQGNTKLKKEKKKPLVPFHHRQSLDKERPEALKSHVGAMTKGLPTSNVSTSVTQKRHLEVAFPQNSRKYQSTTLVNTSGISGPKGHAISAKTEDKCLQPPTSLLKVNPSILSSKAIANNQAEMTVKVESNNFEDFVGNKDSTASEDTVKKCYALPSEVAFTVPLLPSDPLDCRPLGDLMVSKDVPTPSPLETTLWESSKRPSIDGGIECIPSPAKRRRESSTSRSRSDSTGGGGRLKGRRNSSQPSPATTPLSDPFTPQPEELDMEMIQPPMKSPTQVKPPSNKPRRRSSATGGDSPSVPLPGELSKPPSRVKNRRQSSRKKQQEEKERLSKEMEEIKPCPVVNEKGTFPSFSSSDDEHEPIARLPTNLMTEQDLAVTVNDLDQLFDTDEEDDELGQSKAMKIDFVSNQVAPFDPIMNINTPHTIMSTVGVTNQDLARMFPTPPSQETVTHSPPCSVGNDYISPGSVKTIMHNTVLSPESHLMHLAGVDAEREKQHSPMELGPVFEIPKVQEFPVSYSFEAVVGLPDYQGLPSVMQYSPSWQQASQRNWTSSETKVESATEVLSCDITIGAPSPAVGFTNTHPASVNSDVKHLTSAAMSPASPASSVSSFSMPMQFPKTFHGSSLVVKPIFQTPLPEANSLSKVLNLSDSCANYFSDKCYDSVSLCSCLTSSEGVQAKGNKGRDSDYCVCGFGALEAVKFTAGTGLFPDDIHSTSAENVKTLKKVNNVPQSAVEVKKEGSVSHCVRRRASATAVSSQVPFCLLEEIVSQCSSPFSCYNLKLQLMFKGHHGIVKHVSGAWSQNKGAENGIPQKVPHPTAVGALNFLRQLMQDALQKSTSRKTWEQPNGTVVQGPLSWKQLHHLATKGNEETPHAQPIPSVTVGYGGDWMSLSPIALHFWEKLLLEPYSCQRDVAYIVVAPENELVLNNVKLFFKEFSAVYETCRLGQHVAITKVLRDGILRIGQKSLKLAKEPVDDWFSHQGCSSDAAKLKLYAQVFKHQLGPYLASLNLDRHLLELEKGDKSDDKGPSKFGSDVGMDSTPKPGSTSAGTPNSEQAPSAFGEDESEQNSEDPPTVVVYIVNPFSNSSREESFPSYVGLLRCIADILPDLTESNKKNVVFQVVPIQQILQVDTLNGSRDATLTFVTQLKCLAFSVFSRCRKSLQLNINAKSLTGFGPAARHEALLRQREMENAKVYAAPYVLCHPIPMPPSDSADENATSLQALAQNASVLYCGYCLSHDDNYLLAVCTDSVGELIESCVITVEKCLRPDGRPRKTPARTKALIKLWEFCQGVVATSLVPWRLVVSKLGRIGPEELKDWKEILSKTSVMAGDQKFNDTCKACFSLKQKNRPAILGTSLTSLEPEPSIRLYMARALPKVNVLFEGNSSTRVSVGAVPKPDVSRTYIAVMPVASLKCTMGNQSSAKMHALPETTTETVVTDTDILLAGVDDDENDQDPLRHLFPLLNSSPPSLSPTGCILPSPLDTSPIQGTSPLTRPATLTASPGVSVSSPFQPISRLSPFQPLHSTPSPSTANAATVEVQEDGDDKLSVPYAQGYIISTVQTGKMPGTFWASSSHSETCDPVILKASLHIHNPDLMEGMNGFVTAWHPLATKSHCHVLRSILQTYDALSWLTVDPVNRDRRSCLPVHLYMLCQLHETLTLLLENQSS